MSILQRTLIAGCVAGLMTLSAPQVLADGFVRQHCCGWFTGWFGYPPAPAYYAGPLSGATYEYYYQSYWGRPHLKRRRVLVK